MNNEIAIGEEISLALDKVLRENPTSPQEIENRWKKGFNAIFSFLSRAAARFFVSMVKSEEIAQTQSYIRQIFRQTDHIDKIKGDIVLQNAFLAGYIHGFANIVDSFEVEISFLQNDSLKSVISSYKYTEPILLILDRDFEISHMDLANELGISKSALSNYMKKMERYHLFNFTLVGKNKYYSLAYPNGHAALKMIKKNNNISADSYTEFLLLLIESLRKISTCNESGRVSAMEECGKIILQLTTKPTLCKKKLDDLAFILKAERVYVHTLLDFEKKVERTVLIFTKDPKSEKLFRDTIIDNLNNKISYHWYFIATEQFNTEEKMKEAFFSDFIALATDKKFENKVQCTYIPKDRIEGRFKNISDAVIYDGNKGFICEDKLITEGTPYISMSEDQILYFNEYVNDDSFQRIAML